MWKMPGETRKMLDRQINTWFNGFRISKAFAQYFVIVYVERKKERKSLKRKKERKKEFEKKERVWKKKESEKRKKERKKEKRLRKEFEFESEFCLTAYQPLWVI